MRYLIGPAALGALLIAAPAFAGEGTGPAPSGPAPSKLSKAERACFRASDVHGFNVVDDRTVDVSVSPRNVYRLKLFARSPDIDWTQSIGIQARGSTWVCSGADATIIVPGEMGVRRYPVTEVRKLTPEELAERKKKR